MAFAIRADNAKNNSKIHQSRGNKGQEKERYFCTHCNFHGHTIEKCYKLHGYSPGYKQKQKAQNVAINHVIISLLVWVIRLIRIIEMLGLLSRILILISINS